MSISIYDIIKSPIITEKATAEKMNLNKYSFYVDLRANKNEIKKAVETLFEVTVLGVNTRKVLGKKKRMGRFEGRRADRKKATVTLKEGNRIKLLEGP